MSVTYKKGQVSRSQMEHDLEEKRKVKLKKRESFREVQESIKKYECKNEFVQVKLQTRQSFREDQDALNRRLYRKKSEKMSKNEEEKRSKDGQTGDELGSKLENIVLDLTQDKEHTNGIRKNESNGHVNNGYVNGDVNGDVNDVGVSNDRLQSNGTDCDSTKVTHNDTSERSNGHNRVSMTPEPRLKARGRLYEKNDKLTASSSNHLDQMSLKGFKVTNHPINGFGPEPIVVQQARDPLLPAATVTDIPKDGNLRHFSEQQMVTIFRLLNVREDTVHRLFNNKIDGKRFSMFTDKDLQTLGILNPIIRYFRDRSNPPPKKLQKFML